MQHRLLTEERLVANLRQLNGFLLALNQDMQEKLIKQDYKEARDGIADL